MKSPKLVKFDIFNLFWFPRLLYINIQNLTHLIWLLREILQGEDHLLNGKI